MLLNFLRSFRFPAAILISLYIRFLLMIRDGQIVDSSVPDFIIVLLVIIIFIWLIFSILSIIRNLILRIFSKIVESVLSILMVYIIWINAAIVIDLSHLAIMYPTYASKQGSERVLICWERVVHTMDPGEPFGRVLVYEPVKNLSDINREFFPETGSHDGEIHHLLGKFYLMTIDDDGKYCPYPD